MTTVTSYNVTRSHSVPYMVPNFWYISSDFVHVFVMICTDLIIFEYLHAPKLRPVPFRARVVQCGQFWQLRSCTYGVAAFCKATGADNPVMTNIS